MRTAGHLPPSLIIRRSLFDEGYGQRYYPIDRDGVDPHRFVDVMGWISVLALKAQLHGEPLLPIEQCRESLKGLIADYHETKRKFEIINRLVNQNATIHDSGDVDLMQQCRNLIDMIKEQNRQAPPDQRDQLRSRLDDILYELTSIKQENRLLRELLEGADVKTDYIPFNPNPAPPGLVARLLSRDHLLNAVEYQEDDVDVFAEDLDASFLVR
jgi:hypothetical protein